MPDAGAALSPIAATDALAVSVVVPLFNEEESIPALQTQHLVRQANSKRPAAAMHHFRPLAGNELDMDATGAANEDITLAAHEIAIGLLAATAIDNEQVFFRQDGEQGRQENRPRFALYREGIAVAGKPGQHESDRSVTGDMETLLDLGFGKLGDLAHSISSTRSREDVSSRPQPCAISALSC